MAELQQLHLLSHISFTFHNHIQPLCVNILLKVNMCVAHAGRYTSCPDDILNYLELCKNMCHEYTRYIYKQGFVCYMGVS